MKARYSKRAIHDLISAADYMRDRNPRALLAIEQRNRSAIRQLELFPFIGRTTDDPEIRVLPIVHYPYLVFYEVLQDEIIIHHIRHGRRAAPGPVDTQS
jgi:toxin ParE1/3/4